MADNLIYLDNNATTRVDDKVLEARLSYLKKDYANPTIMYNFSNNS